jgi:hypothetical protein
MGYSTLLEDSNKKAIKVAMLPNRDDYRWSPRWDTVNYWRIQTRRQLKWLCCQTEMIIACLHDGRENRLLEDSNKKAAEVTMLAHRNDYRWSHDERQYTIV